MTREHPTTVVDETRELPPEFAPYLASMGFLAEVLGPGAEIVLHDTSDPASSIVALTNGHISGRRIGGPATDLVLAVLQGAERGERDGGDWLTNYEAQSNDGRRFRSSTLFIRDAAGDVVGMLCVNIDDEPLAQARDLLAAITATRGLDKTGERVAGPPVAASPVAERFSTSVDELARDAVARVVAAGGIDPARMGRADRLRVVRELDRAGIFLLKGAVAQAATALRASEPTVYRYLRQVRR